jgi:adenosylmethionine-8-amino-7-oxononanoate aminotransferase
VQRIIARESLVERVRERGKTLLQDVRAALERFDAVGDVRGRGFFIGIELVRDPRTREPFAPADGISQKVGRLAFEDGLIIYPCAGHIGGLAGDTIVIAPPYNASESELAELVDKLTAAVARALASA